MSQGKLWQQQWHQILDRELGADEHGIPDIREDFRIHFDSWQLPEAALRECFSMLPCGEDMVERVLNRLTGPGNDEEALDILRQGLSDLTFHVGDDFGDVANLRVIRGNDTVCIDIFMSADTPTITLDDSLYRMVREHSGEEGDAAFHFLRETLYRLASHYAIANWISWPLCHDVKESDPYRNFARLAESGNYFPGWDNEGVFLFILEDK